MTHNGRNRALRVAPPAGSPNDRANIPLTRELAAGIPGAELRIVPDATHLWNLQQPEAFKRTVADLVDQAEAAEV